MQEDVFQADVFDVVRTIRSGKFNNGQITVDLEVTSSGLVVSAAYANPGSQPVDFKISGSPLGLTPGRQVAATWPSQTSGRLMLPTTPTERILVTWDAARNRYNGLEGETKTSV